jgi:succinate dehydrogenase/fumarate reductase-like Fe-S protein
MGKMIHVTILRHDPLTGELPISREYRIPASRSMTILEILQQIYRSEDPTLAFRAYRCGRRICRSCEIKLDGKIVRGCATLLRPGKSYWIEPAHPESLLRDLVFAFDHRP